jgi:serine acetyltransferase
MYVATTIDRAGLERVGIAATTLAFGMEYFRGLREELGSRGATMRDYKTFLQRHRGQGGVLGAAVRLVDAVRTDHQSLGDYRNKYVHEPAGALRKDLLEKIGLQIMVGVRVMRFFQDSGASTAAKITSRAMRFFYGSDVHWGADFGEGVAIAHGFGLAISRSAKVGARCILFHSVTLAESMDATTRIVGAPTLEADVHVGPGSTLIGPITIGAGTKIMAGCVITQSIPAGSLVEAPKPTITVRAREARTAAE